MSLIFGIVGNVVAVVLAVKAFVEAGAGGRIALLVLMGATFLAPRVFPGLIVSQVAFIVRMLVGIGCFVFLKYRGEL